MGEMVLVPLSALIRSSHPCSSARVSHHQQTPSLAHPLPGGNRLESTQHGQVGRVCESKWSGQGEGQGRRKGGEENKMCEKG
eukprot:214392-Hanusia_phi.AAC.1